VYVRELCQQVTFLVSIQVVYKLPSTLYILQFTLPNPQAYTVTEVQQSLPHQAYQFALIDKQWRELMHNTSRNPNVMQLCCKAGKYP